MCSPPGDATDDARGVGDSPPDPGQGEARHHGETGSTKSATRVACEVVA
jgi:hypothetical protein